MGLLDKLKSLFGGKAKDVAESLGLGDQVAELVEGLVGKLEGLLSGGSLPESLSGILANFKPILEKFKGKEIGAEQFTGEAKNLVSNLEGVSLPEDVSGLLDKVKGLLGSKE